MRTSKILELVKMVEDHNIEEIEISRLGQKIKISKSGTQVVSSAAVAQPMATAQTPMPQPNIQPSTEAPSVPADTQKTLSTNSVEIKSPMVGTFYAALAPDADNFVKVGDQISAGQTLCIVEAMKVMNEIESEISGTLVKILVENGEPVEFDQPLFIVEK